MQFYPTYFDDQQSSFLWILYLFTVFSFYFHKIKSINIIYEKTLKNSKNLKLLENFSKKIKNKKINWAPSRSSSSQAKPSPHSPPNRARLGSWRTRAQTRPRPTTLDVFVPSFEENMIFYTRTFAICSMQCTTCQLCINTLYISSESITKIMFLVVTIKTESRFLLNLNRSPKTQEKILIKYIYNKGAAKKHNPTLTFTMLHMLEYMF